MHRPWDDPTPQGHRRRWPAAVKVAAALILLVLLITLPPSWKFFAAATALLLGAAALSRLPPVLLLKRLLMLEPFVVGVAILTLLQPHGLPIFGIIVARTTLCVATLVLLSAATTASELLSLLRALRVPALMITTLALMHRYLHVLQDESRRMRCARQSRTFTSSRRHAWRSLATVIAQLFIRAAARSERIYAAMCARGWQ
ncbi:MAG: CbiQ family ECF transporter T component [Tepidisphaeraceae bacterium]